MGSFLQVSKCSRFSLRGRIIIPSLFFLSLFMPLTAFSQQASQQASEETPGLVNWSRVLNAIEGINNIRHFPDQVESLNRDQVCPSREPNLSPDSRVVERICACEGCSSPLHNPPLFAQAIQPPAGFLIAQ
jgi:hypothetical protein